MNDKFKYAPGRPGVGTKGNKGEDGKQGLGMYFTNLNPNSQSSIINTRIRDDRDLWAGPSGGASLPDNRVYLTGDLFFDQEGLAYEINAETNTFEYKFASLNMGGFFLPLGISSSDGFQRYFNSNASPKFLIDNVYTLSGAIDYTDAPERIYNIEPKDFTRIEYTNIKVGTGNYNPFTVYSSAETISENHKALAIVYDEANLAFRIGNLDDAGNIRNTNLKFDVSALIHSKNSGGRFSLNTPEGAILTNYEINANPLFDPNFNSDPDSFSVTYQTLTSDISINWVLLDFVPSYDSASLHVAVNKKPYGGSYSFDASAFRELVFTDLPATGSLLVTNCPSINVYSCFIKITKNGWTRNSVTKNAFAAILNVTPSSFVLSSSDAGTVGFDVDSNFEWVAYFSQNPSNFMSIDSSTMGSYDGSLNIDFTANDSTQARLGKIRVQPIFGGTYKDVSIWQPRGTVPPEMSLINNSKVLTYSWPYYYVDVSRNGNVGGSNPWTVDVSANCSWEVDVMPPWVSSVYPSSGSAGVTSIAISVNESLVIENTRNGSIEFVNGANPLGSLTLYQSGVDVWAENNGDRYDFPLYLEYNGGSNIWSINSTPLSSGTACYLNMRFTDSVAINWQWDNTTLGWLQFTERSGTGDYYGPTLEAKSPPSGYEWIDCSAGGVDGYPLTMNVTGY